MPKIWQPGKKGTRDLTRHISQHGKGAVVYTIARMATNLAPYEDPAVYVEHAFTWRSPITGHWMTGHKSVEGLLNTEGTVYEQPPRGMRRLGDPPPQVAGPLGSNDYRGYLDDAEIRGLEKHVKNGSDPYTREMKGGAAKPKRSWW